MILKILVPILGGIIGYFTNWLAIKMLFFPREAKYIGKFKIPLTPGIIPKGKDKIAKKIAKAAEEHLLNKETIKSNIFTDANKEKIYIFLKNNLENLKNKNLTLGEFIKSIGVVEENLVDFITEKLKQILLNEINREFLFEFITGKIITLNNNIREINYSKEISELSDNSISSNNILVMQKIETFLDSNLPEFINYIIKNLENNEKFNEKFKNITVTLIENKIGTIPSLFINKEKIYVSIKNSIFEYLKNADNLSNIKEAVMEGEIIKVLLPENLEPKQVNEFLKGIINDKDCEIFINKIINFIFKSKNSFLNLKINTFVEKIEIENYKSKILSYIESFAEKNGDKLAGQIDIYSMIENKIMSFDMKMTEEIIFSIAKKELNYVTFIGGVLGFLIGLVSLFF